MNMQKLLEHLNDAQRQAVSAALDDNLLVLAGAGSGKTRVLVHRIFWLLQNNVPAGNVLAVTFTNKAAAEMRNRVEQMLGASLDKMWIGTFHGLAHRLLRIHWREAGLPQSFQVMDAEDQLRMLKRIHKTFNLDEERWPAKQTQSYINDNKDRCLRSKQLKADNPVTATLLKIYQEYETTCQRSGLVDFSELLLRAYELFLHNEQILADYKRRFKYLLVDEFQDTNGLQYAWIRLLAEGSAHLMVVGDDDQSIYSWRGADVENMQHLIHDFQVKIIRLERNYRSTAIILQAANAVIANNSNRLGKKLWTDGVTGELIAQYAALNEFEEARYITAEICKFKDHAQYCYNDIAILYRSNAQSRVLEEQLLQRQIPYIIYGGLRFYERAEVKDVLAYLRLTANNQDDAAFERIFNVPTRGLGDTTLLLLREYAQQRQLSLYVAAVEMCQTQQLPARAANALQAFLQLLVDFSQQAVYMELHELVNYITNGSGLRVHFARDKTERGMGRIENLDELVNAARQFALSMQESDNATLLNLFLAHAFLEAAEEEQSGLAKDRVRLMTLHAAKGLEFPVVFMCGMENGLFPHMMSMELPAKLEEERRLCYVGMTRAMQRLFLTYAITRQVYGSTSSRKASQFLSEIPSQLVNYDGMTTSISQPVTARTSLSSNYASRGWSNRTIAPGHKTADTVKNIAAAKTAGKYAIGQNVRHAKFGEGTITAFEGDGDKLLIQINFARVGSKWLAANVVKLEVC